MEAPPGTAIRKFALAELPKVTVAQLARHVSEGMRRADVALFFFPLQAGRQFLKPFEFFNGAEVPRFAGVLFVADALGRVFDAVVLLPVAEAVDVVAPVDPDQAVFGGIELQIHGRRERLADPQAEGGFVGLGNVCDLLHLGLGIDQAAERPAPNEKRRRLLLSHDPIPRPDPPVLRRLEHGVANVPWLRFVACDVEPLLDSEQLQEFVFAAGGLDDFFDVGRGVFIGSRRHSTREQEQTPAKYQVPHWRYPQQEVDQSERESRNGPLAPS